MTPLRSGGLPIGGSIQLGLQGSSGILKMKIELRIPDKDVDTGPFRRPHPCPKQPKEKPGHDSHFPLNPEAHPPPVSLILSPNQLRY